jgi:hypothetical protein
MALIGVCQRLPRPTLGPIPDFSGGSGSGQRGRISTDRAVGRTDSGRNRGSAAGAWRARGPRRRLDRAS